MGIKNINLNGVQGQLVSGTNIKTVNGTSLLGSGNISTASGFQGTIVIADSPTTDGIYRPIQEGTYTNAGGLTYLPSTTDEGYQVEFVLSGGIWTKSRVDIGISVASIVEENNPNPVSSEAVEAYAMEFDEFATVVVGKNLFDESKIVDGQYVASSGGSPILSAPGWGRSDFIPIVAGETYTLSGIRGRVGFAFYASKVLGEAALSYSSASGLAPITEQAPVGANFAVFNLYDTANPNYSNVQFEEGTVNTSYEQYYETKKLKASKIPRIEYVDSEPIENSDNLIESGGVFLISKKLNSITTGSRNLFDENSIQNGYLDNSGNILVNSTWGRSEFIPVIAGEEYTLSGIRGRHGLAFFENDTDVTPIVGSYVSTIENFTVTAPPTANYVVFNVFSESSPTYSDVQFEKGDVPTPYVSFDQILINPDALPPAGSEVGEEPTTYIFLDSSSEDASYVATEVDGKVLKTYLRLFNTDERPVDIVKTTLDGAIIKASGDDTAPYRIADSTIGANHNGGASNKNKTRKMFLDGVEISEELVKLEMKESLKVIENYTLAYPTMSDELAEISYTFVFDKHSNCVIYTDILGLKDDTNLQDIMFVMAHKLSVPYSLLVPKSLPITFEGNTYDFSESHDMSTFSITGRIDFTPSVCEPTGILCDRAISIMTNGLNYQIGFIPVQVASLVNRRVNAERKALQISNIAKIYMSGVDSSTINKINEGDYYSAVAYKGFSAPRGNSASFYMVSTELGIYVYIDWLSVTFDKVEMPTETIGKGFEIIEASSSVSILSEENTGKMVFDVSGKGYVILKFK